MKIIINKITMIEIRTAQELQDMNKDLTESYKLMNNIDMTGFDWVPVGNIDALFEGELDGNGFTISNLVNDYTDKSYNGLFGGMSSNGYVHDLKLRDIKIKGNTDVGGVVGYSYGTIKRCSVTGTITATSSNADAGGITAVNATNTSTIQDCWTNTTVNSVSGAGGIAGHNNFGLIKNCYAIGDNYATYAGGIAGRQNVQPQLYFEDNFWDTETCNNTTSAGEGNGVTGKTTIEMKQQATYTNWDFTDVWYIQEGIDYPKLRYNPATNNGLEFTAVRSNNISLTSERSNNISIEVSR